MKDLHLKNLNLKELKALSKEHSIKGRSTMNKEQLVNALSSKNEQRINTTIVGSGKSNSESVSKSVLKPALAAISKAQPKASKASKNTLKKLPCPFEVIPRYMPDYRGTTVNWLWDDNGTERTSTAVVDGIVYDEKEDVVMYSLKWTQDNSPVSHNLQGLYRRPSDSDEKQHKYIWLNELYEEIIGLPSTLRTRKSAFRYKLWGNIFTPCAYAEFNTLEAEPGEEKLHFEWPDCKKYGINYLQVVSEIHKFFKLLQNPTGTADLPDHPALEKYTMTASNVRGRNALIGSSGLRIKPEWPYCIKKGTILGIYKGTVCTKAEAEEYKKEYITLGTGDGYQFNILDDDFVIDPMIPNSPQGLLMFANDVGLDLTRPNGPVALPQNCIFKEVDLYGWTYIVLFALKDLVPGQEIGVNYGSNF